MNLLIVIVLLLFVADEIIYILKNLDIIKNVEYKVKYDATKEYIKSLQSDIKELKLNSDIQRKRINSTDDVIKKLKKIPTATKRKLGLLDIRKEEK